MFLVGKQMTAYESGLGIHAEPLFRSTYNWEAVNPDVKADGIGYNLFRKYPSGLTLSQLYVFMPPNIGGFFMVRSYYPSECNADYFVFVRIEGLKPAIVACGISSLSLSPTVGLLSAGGYRLQSLEGILSCWLP